MAKTSTSILQVEPINDFKEYIDFIAELGDIFTQNLCLFRGQLYDKPLVPKLGSIPPSKYIYVLIR
jgi:hypothetical protein